MKVLITGIKGFVAGYLAELLVTEGHSVWGTVRETDNQSRHCGKFWGNVNLINTDLDDQTCLEAILKESCPDIIYHLAAQSSVHKSWECKESTFETNVLGTIRLMEAIKRQRPNSRVLIVGSSEEYGFVTPEQVPVKENTPLSPMSPYGASKAAVSLLVSQYFKAEKIQIIYTRSFNHIGPGQALGFVTSDFAKQIAEMEQGLRESFIKVGNLEACRDFTDVRDVVRAYYLLTKEGRAGEIYNVCSGKVVSIKQILQILLGMARVKITTQTDPLRVRPSDVPILQGDSTKLIRDTAWQPVVPLEVSLSGVLDYWREVVRSQNELEE